MIQLQDSIALLRSRSTHFYTCSGCIPDNTIELVLLDPVALHPVSKVVELPPRQAGFVGRSTALIGSNILISFSMIYHAGGDPSFAAFRCD